MPVDETLICTLDEGPSAAATAAFGLWLGDSVGARPLVCSPRSAIDLIAVAAEHRARLIVTAGSNEAATERAIELTYGLDGALVVLPQASLELWLNPSEARRRASGAVVAGSDGSAASIEAARIAGRIAAGLGGSALIAHARSAIATGEQPSRPASPLDPIAEGELDARLSLLGPALAAAREHGATVEARFASATAVEALNDLAATEHSPLIAVGASRPPREGLALARSVTGRIIARAERPILIATSGPPSGRDDELTTTDPQHAGTLPAPAVDPLTRT